MPRTDTLIVVSQRGDIPAGASWAVTADEFLSGEAHDTGDVGAQGVQVVNLCRTWRHMSKGYYVSLLADARGQVVVPSVDTLRALNSPDDNLRVLGEAGVPILREKDAEGRAADTVQATIYMGSCADKRFRRVTSLVYRLWPAPVLRVTLIRDSDRWNVADVSPVPFGKLEADDVTLVMEAIAGRGNSLDTAPVPEKEIAIAVLFDDKDPHKPSSADTIDRLARVAAPMGVHVQRIGPGDIARLSEYDALFVRVVTGIDLPSYRFVLHAEQLGMPVIDDSRSIIRCTNKVFLHELCSRHGLPTPPTLTLTRETGYAEVRRQLGTPFILKLPTGAFSTAVFKIADARTYDLRSGEMFKSSPLLVAQGYMPTAFDWRVGVLDGKPLFVARYHMARGHWQISNSTARGARFGRVEAVPRKQAPRKVVALGVKVAKLIGTGLYGVDIKESPQGPVIIEINDNPNMDLDQEDQCEGDTIYRELIASFVARIKQPKKPTPPSAPARTPTPESDADALRAPIGKLPRKLDRPFRPFEVCGLELEYPVVDRDLHVAHLAPQVLTALAGSRASDAHLGVVGVSNEIMDHVVEVKTEVPLRSLVDTEKHLVEGVRRVTTILATRHDARLMPTAMHPWFSPPDALLWTRSNRKIYETYARLFDTRTHGWANVHACHVNLPMGTDEEAVHLMNAAAMLVPYLPALAASSPVFDGKLGPAVDNRLLFIMEHQQRVPESCGRVVPELIWSMAQYRKEVLAPMYRAVDQLVDAEALRPRVLQCPGRRLEGEQAVHGGARPRHAGVREDGRGHRCFRPRGAGRPGRAPGARRGSPSEP